MFVRTDSFGTYAGGTPGVVRASRIADHVVTWVLVLCLALVGGVAAYALLDQYQVWSAGSSGGSQGLSFRELRALNPDVIAWLKVDGTKIDYPVLLGKDNFEYLDKDAQGNYSASGSLFLDSACDPNFNESYEVIYGHHMAGHAMFGDLDLFDDESFFDANSTATLELPQETLSLEVVAVLEADAYDGTIFGTAASDGRVAEVDALVRQKAMHVRDSDLDDTSHLIALSTCSSDVGANARTVVLCKVVGRVAADNA